MASRYVPPALRGKDRASVDDDNASHIISSEDKVGRRLSDLQLDEPLEEVLYTLPEIASFFWPDDQPNNSKTLHAAADTPKTLRYTLLFRDANPRWASDQIIFVKTNLDLLPGYSNWTEASGDSNEAYDASQEHRELDQDEASPETNEEDQPTITTTDSNISEGSPSDNPGVKANEGSQLSWDGQIAVFEQHSGNRAIRRNFRFIGWYDVGSVEFLRQHSEELVRTLEQKWNSNTTRYKQGKEDKERAAEAWQHSLSIPWAILKLSQTDENQEKPAPKIVIDKSSDNVGNQHQYRGRGNRRGNRGNRGGRGFWDRRYWRDERAKREGTLEEPTEGGQDEEQHET